MNARVSKWTGAPELRECIEAWLTGEAAEVEVAESPRRRLVRIAGPKGEPLLVKEFARRAGLRGARDVWKTRVGRFGAQRERRALCALWSEERLVPRWWASARTTAGSTLLVCEWCAGERADRALLAASGADRRAVLGALGDRVAALHARGWVHGDLHLGNLVVSASQVRFVDLQRARRSQRLADRLADVGALDFSLARCGASRADRLRVRRAALAVAALSAAEGRELLRQAGEASRRRARDHYASRTRKCLRPGRAFAALEIDGARGLRTKEISEHEVRRAVALHRQLARTATEALPNRIGREIERRGTEVLKHDHRAVICAVELGDRSVVVKQVIKSGLPRRLADAVRGSPARRGWIAGHGLAARRIRCARPLALLEERRLGVVVASWLVSEDLRGALPISELNHSDAPGERVPGAALAELLAGWVARMHRRGACHGDLQALHVYLQAASDAVGAARGQEWREPVLIDLEDVRLRATLPEALRLRELAELNASVADRVIGAAARRRALGLYLSAHPSRRPAAEIAREIARASRSRRGAWRGEDCPR